MLVEAARVFAPLRVGERTHTHTQKKNRKEAQRHRQHPRDSASHPFSADTPALINSRISQVVDIYRRQSPGANTALKSSKVLDLVLGSESNCV